MNLGNTSTGPGDSSCADLKNTLVRLAQQSADCDSYIDVNSCRVVSAPMKVVVWTKYRNTSSMLKFFSYSSQRVCTTEEFFVIPTRNGSNEPPESLWISWPAAEVCLLGDSVETWTAARNSWTDWWRKVYCADQLIAERDGLCCNTPSPFNFCGLIPTFLTSCLERITGYHSMLSDITVRKLGQLNEPP